MSTLHTIKQLEERNVPNEINFMVWSDKMDLVAFSNVKGEVALHRLTWSRAWSLSPPKDGLTVNCMAWRPDGKVLAIAYSCGRVQLVGVENKKILNIQEIKGNITCITWVQEKLEASPRDNFNFKDDKPNNYMKHIDMSKLYLRDPTPSSVLNGSNSEDHKEAYFLQEQTELNLLLIGTKEGMVHVRIFGCFTCCILDMKEYLHGPCSVEHLKVSEDLTKIFVVTKNKSSLMQIFTVNSSIFKSHAKELFAVAMKYVKLMDLVTYLRNTIASITETWESFLLEIDHKLSRYAKKVPEGGITADFLDLLIFGICSPELQEFLMHDLTKKGLEKFGQTIEMSYTNIQKLLLKNVNKYGQNVTFQLAELRDRWTIRRTNNSGNPILWSIFDQGW
ncbi:unnamed protein product [Callosobruchus maculatus]|uniref:Anaphase-promoting complex subunit 4 n=1 Tax=Callosobruchus maculatus TaxID=64391 RepID=A0A653BM50_CALMS|nr:unnamed protein product [Callosobruchus maculatus]